ncbi:MAG TPA: Crp/Fnr family transcriptional regulator [Bradyrhizobium sp.]|nr:Crp/Fnr family transcriptional regulator [Bradyrhizobium sp.]
MDTAAFANRLLGDLPRADFDLLSPHLGLESFAQGAVLAEAGDEIDHAWFPNNGMISLLTMLRDGKAIETATIGRQGVFGAAAAFGLYRTRVRAIVQLPMTAATLPAPALRRAAESSKAIQLLCMRYNEVLLAQARITAACNALHMIEARFCRWLLQTSHISGSTTVTLTQEFLSEMLGVRRTSVTEVASKLQSAGLISYSRGVIHILDMEALRQKSCECFETLQEQKAI